MKSPFLVRDDCLSSWRYEISSIWFYTGKQREIGIPVASWLTRLTNDWINLPRKQRRVEFKQPADQCEASFWLEAVEDRQKNAREKLKTIANINDKWEECQDEKRKRKVMSIQSRSMLRWSLFVRTSWAACVGDVTLWDCCVVLKSNLIEIDFEVKSFIRQGWMVVVKVMDCLSVSSC